MTEGDSLARERRVVRTPAEPGERGAGLRALSGDRIWDILVVGAGPAGSMAAYQLARRGKDVLLVDRDRFPRWKVCGATLSPGAQAELARAGLAHLLEESGAVPLTTFRVGGWVQEVDLPLNGSMALSRNVLDLALIREAEAAGVRFLQGVRAALGPMRGRERLISLSAGRQRLDVQARVVLAADGLSSGLMAQAGVPSRPPSSRRRPLVGLGQVFPAEVPFFEPGVIHMAVGAEGYLGLTRVEDGSLDVAAAVRPQGIKAAGSPHALVLSLLKGAGWPGLPDAGEGGWKGTPELTRRPEGLGAEGLLAVGDASGYVEPFTGEGIFWALAGARALAPLAEEAAEAWRPALLDEWTRIHHRLVGRAQRYCRTLAWALARPSVTRNALRLLGRYPALADPVVRRVGAPMST